ncbi:hypothetical protein [Micromonospora chalcea]|uniref:hypothetical protein n=1 Tax=Micromonospora chalcea TaxID=1874 RepID=UPI003332910C
MSVAYTIFAVVVAALLGWAINQLPALKHDSPTWLRLGVVAVLIVMSVAASIITNRLDGDQKVTNQTGPKTNPTSTSNPDHTAGPAPTSSTDPTSVPTAALLRSGSVILNDGQVMNLDAPAREPRWGIDYDCACPDTQQDLKWSSDEGFERPTWAFKTFLLLLDGRVDDPQVCPARTGYSEDPIRPDEIKQGSSLCIQTAENNFALIKVTQIGRKNKAIHFDVRVIGGS